jgi:hypothetical protein
MTDNRPIESLPRIFANESIAKTNSATEFTEKTREKTKGSPVIPEKASGRCNGKLKNLATDLPCGHDVTDLHGLEKKISENP